MSAGKGKGKARPLYNGISSCQAWYLSLPGNLSIGCSISADIKPQYVALSESVNKMPETAVFQWPFSGRPLYDKFALLGKLQQVHDHPDVQAALGLTQPAVQNHRQLQAALGKGELTRRIGVAQRAASPLVSFSAVFALSLYFLCEVMPDELSDVTNWQSCLRHLGS